MKRFIILNLLFGLLSLGAMENIKIIDVDNTPITSLIRLISENNDLNIVPSIKARQTKISIYLKNINPIIALEEICSSHNLWLQKDPVKNIYRIHSLDEYKKSILKFSEEIKVYDLKYPNSKTISKSIFELFPSRVIYFESNRENLDDEVEEIERKLEKLRIFEEQNDSSGNNQNNNRFQNNQSNFDRNDNGRSNNRNSENNNSSQNGNGDSPRDVKLPEKTAGEKFDLTPEVIHKINTAESIEEIRKIINNQDIFKNSRIYISSILNKNQMIIRTGDLEALAKIDKLIEKLDKPNPMVLLEMKILAVTLDDSFESAFDIVYNDGASSATLNAGLIQTNGALTYSYIDKKFNATLTLLEKEEKVRTLATPVILTLNREVSKFFTGNQSVPILTGFAGDNQTIVNDTTIITTVPTPIYENRDLGTTLKVSPIINSNKSVQLQISMIESELDPNSANILIPSGDTFISQSVDTEKRRSFTGTVLAHDGKMIAVGGIIKESDIEIEAGVPILRDIPLLSYIFAEKKKVRLREEIIILIKPYVIYNEDDHKNLSKDLLKRISEHPNANGQKDKLKKFKTEE
jgi:type II secretory pathway component GspD/PulD (secretin)